MGEYYNWINVDKREFLSPGDFDYGSKQWESLGEKNELLSALYELLDSDWKGDHVIWFGDEKSVPENSDNAVLRTLYDQSVEYGLPGDGFDTVCETYHNISGLFKRAEERVLEEIQIFLEERMRPTLFDYNNEYLIDPGNPYKGLFQREGKRFRYIINETKRVCYSPDSTVFYDEQGHEHSYSDPFPLLMRFGRVKEPGIWLGDIIRVSDDYDDRIYTFLDRVPFDW